MTKDTVARLGAGSRGARCPRRDRQGKGQALPISRHLAVALDLRAARGRRTALPPRLGRRGRAGSARPFSAERSHGEGAVPPLPAAIRRHPPQSAGSGCPPRGDKRGRERGSRARGAGVRGSGGGMSLGGPGMAAARNASLNTSRPLGPRPQEASETRGCAQALDAGQADGRLRECGPGLGLKLGSGLGLGLRPGSEVGPG